jgi:hypothetical protein
MGMCVVAMSALCREMPAYMPAEPGSLPAACLARLQPPAVVQS